MKRKELIESEDMLKVAADISAAENILEKTARRLDVPGLPLPKTGQKLAVRKTTKRCLSILEASPNVSIRLVALCHHRLALVCHLSLLFKAEKYFKKASELMGASDQGALQSINTETTCSHSQRLRSLAQSHATRV